MRFAVLLVVLALGACATDPAAYDARCMRLRAPLNYDATTPGGATPGVLGVGTKVGAAPDPAPVLEVNCEEGKTYGVEGEAPVAGEPQPL